MALRDIRGYASYVFAAYLALSRAASFTVFCWINLVCHGGVLILLHRL
jgi:hypothetical protein